MTDASTPRVLALIPAYNESARIVPVIEAAHRALPVLVVDDGSKDDTADRAEAAGATVHRQVPNQGKGAALRSGFRWALDAGYDAVITLDADGQHDPAEIPAFLARYVEDRADLIIGARTFRDMPPTRRFANTLGGWLFSWALGQHVPDNQSGYRLISRRLMEATLASAESGFEFEVEMIVLAVREGWPVGWVPIRTIYAGETSHIHPWHHMTNFLRVVRQTRRAMRRNRRPLIPLRLVPLLLLPVIGLLAAILIVLESGGSDTADTPASAFPTPAPVTFVVPTFDPAREPDAPPPQAVALDVPAPELALPLLDGGEIVLTELRGEIVFFNVWMTWCEPCQREMPVLQQLYEEQDARGIRVVSLTDPANAQTEADIRDFLAAYEATLPVAMSSDVDVYTALFLPLQYQPLPTTFVIDAAGTIRYAHVGELHADDIDRYLALLSE